ncbi:MAG TPA: LPXTG cell wall anchor domain-containing protein [Feifaniaceae bacterium]|nr:LPXTG cell wall anchor domain-containing protein [Feifaniaceae bacterium]
MKKISFTKVAAVVVTLALALVIIGLPGIAKADITAFSVTPTSGQSTDIAVGGSVELNVTNQVGTPLGTETYQWTVTGGTNVSLSATTGTTITVTGLQAANGIVVTATLYVGGVATAITSSVTINVMPMTISETSKTLVGGDSFTLSVLRTTSAGTLTWLSDNSSIASVTAGLVNAVGAGTTTIRAHYVYLSNTQELTCTVTVTPIITLTPTSANITTAGGSQTFTLTVQYGGVIYASGSVVEWTNSNGTAGSITSSSTALSGSPLSATATFTAPTTMTNATTTLTALVRGTSSNTTTKTANIDVRNTRYLTISGDANLSNSDRYGDYVVTLHEANGTVVNDDTSTVHWSWTSSYLKISSAALNDSRADMEDGTAQIQLYARYNTPTAGTKLYVWINSDTAGKISQTIHITGLSSLPQTGQDFTLVYVFGGLCAALLVAAGVWYGIRKKRVDNA